ncbi:aminodeoxychorismate lyase [Candidatus Colwellia aromaticivorans]|uniref:aminodeoxychorismate lyase n=1 Tax=Candidatus Colwellia aromaticivorans TaxID=2267621 RepID=UPI000DF2AB29|nr:aminodeoxychorismate lyase [Candidatus Colwellia aromaticivorans]
MKFCLVNGVEHNQIDIENRGLAYGDGLFTTAKIIDGKIQYLSSHVQRLRLGCKQLALFAPNKVELTEQLSQVAKQYDLAVLKIIITASSGGRGYARSTDPNSDVIIMVHDYPKHYDELAIEGITLGDSNQHIGINPMLSGLKHLNRLEQVLLRQELVNTKEDDLVVTNVNNEVIEATSANLFFWLNGRLCTPDITNSGVNGIMRQTILQKYPDTLIKTVTLAELASSPAMFICNCVMGVMPVKNYNGQHLSIMLSQRVRNAVNQKAINAS